MDSPPEGERAAGKLQVVTGDYRPPRRQKKPPTYRQRWKDHVLRSPQITDAVRVMLIALADPEMKLMKDDGSVEVTQAKVAAVIGRPVRRVYDRYQAAIEAGFLEEVSKGGRGKAVVYQARIPVYDAAAKSKRRGSTSNLSA